MGRSCCHCGDDGGAAVGWRGGGGAGAGTTPPKPRAGRAAAAAAAADVPAHSPSLTPAQQRRPLAGVAAAAAHDEPGRNILISILRYERQKK